MIWVCTFCMEVSVPILLLLLSQNETVCCYNAVRRLKDANGMAKSVDPDQTAL